MNCYFIHKQMLHLLYIKYYSNFNLTISSHQLHRKYELGMIVLYIVFQI